MFSHIDYAMSPEHPLSTHFSSDFLVELLSAARAKARSIETHDNVHIPDLRNRSAGSIECLLLGDSMLERFKTTGRGTPFGPEPDAIRATSSLSLPVTHADDGAETAAGTSSSAVPSTPLSATDFVDPSLVPSFNPTTKIFNAGVGGDSLRNIIYRLTGTLTNPGGLLYALMNLPHEERPSYMFLLAGTNDLGNGRKPLTASSLSQYRFVLRAFDRLFPEIQICVCGLIPKAKVKKMGVIEESNRLLEELVANFNENDRHGEFVVDFLPTNERLGLQHLEDDGVHLNSDGYEILGASMWTKLERMRQISHTE